MLQCTIGLEVYLPVKYQHQISTKSITPQTFVVETVRDCRTKRG